MQRSHGRIVSGAPIFFMEPCSRRDRRALGRAGGGFEGGADVGEAAVEAREAVIEVVQDAVDRHVGGAAQGAPVVVRGRWSGGAAALGNMGRSGHNYNIGRHCGRTVARSGRPARVAPSATT